MGYGAGDAMAMAVAARLSALAAGEHEVARVGGGEFALLLGAAVDQGADPGAAVRALARQVVEVLSRPERLGFAEIAPLPQVGRGPLSDDADSASRLLEAAQTAPGRGLWQRLGGLFTPQIHVQAKRRLAIEAGLRHAIERDELQLRFQLQIDLASGQALGAEVLLHWHSQDLGEVAPAEFLPVARQTELIVALGDWQREAACTVLQNWLHEASSRCGWRSTIRRCSCSSPTWWPSSSSPCCHGLPSVLLGMEVSEQAVMAPPPRCRASSPSCVPGVEIALDDFGTGAPT
jgi:predicted signal transduction protein with EAL and GGDEF domain